jgi:hypothetical protein
LEPGVSQAIKPPVVALYSVHCLLVVEATDYPIPLLLTVVLVAPLQVVLDIFLEFRVRVMVSGDSKVAVVVLQVRQQDHYLLPDSLEGMPEIFQVQVATVIYYLGILHIMLVAEVAEPIPTPP